MSDRISYSVKEAAELTGYSVDAIRKAIRSGALAARYPTSKPVIRHKDLDEWIDNASTFPRAAS